MPDLRPGESRNPDVLLRKPASTKKATPGTQAVPRAEDDPNPRVALGRIFLHGGRMKTQLADAVTGGAVSWSTTEVTQLSLSFEDPGFVLYRSGLFSKGVALLYRDADLNLDLRVSAVTLDGGQAGTGGMTIAARSSAVIKLKKRRGPKVMKKASPSQFVAEECKAVGLKSVVQPSPRRSQVSRDVKGKTGTTTFTGSGIPSSWTTFQRLATELGYVLFEFAGTVYFAQPTWLLKRDTTPVQVAMPLPGAPEVWVSRTMPTISSSDDNKVPVTISGITLPRTRFPEVRPGGGLRLRGLPPFNDAYLIDSMSMPLLGVDGVSVSAMTAENPKPQPPQKATSTAAGGGGGSYDDSTTVEGTGQGTAARFVAIAISASGASYVFGAEALSSDPSPSALDCSELIEWALGRMGIKFPDGSGNQYEVLNKTGVAQAMRIKGALLWKPGHIGISLGDGRSMEARNPRAGVGIFRAADIAWVGGGTISGLRY